MFNQKYLREVEKELSSLGLKDSPQNLYDPVRYFMALGGKRIRPILTLMTAELFGSEADKALKAAVAIELFHNFTLVHDDIMDEAPTRRGKKTVHEHWNSNIAILSGDLILIKAYQQLESYPPEVQARLITILNKTAVEVCEGQQLDMDFENEIQVSIDEYLEMIRLKTSVLLGCALSFGAIIANCDTKQSRAIYDFGVKLGIAFQIQDDILDLFGDSNKVGKLKGGDVLKQKKSILTILAVQNGFEWNELNEFPEDEEKVNFVIDRFTELKIKEKARILMELYSKEALRHLESIESSSARKALTLFAKELLGREN